MIKKVMRKVRKILIINNLNKKFNCDISLKSNIDNFSIFEGRNKIYSRTTIIQSEVGFATYISPSCVFYKTKIGKYCSIGPNVSIIAGNHPTSKYISTHPVFYSDKTFAGLSYRHENEFKEYSYADEKGKYLCEIGNDVWLGQNVKIINGVRIGDGAIVAAGALVSKEVPPYAIVGGVPAKIIKYRFNNEDIDFLLNLQWWNKDQEWLEKNINNFDDVEKLKKTEELECMHLKV
ncbi:CatB-related O-acetyltransferase [Domibacillus indicus]|uniref:CatB-related O-acetyltransferase n=1 Tax=Domibacillus indicus TaxID=1437523 RepID=UPI00203E106B|nr:CatB-related O-acetyltransferase [Domibacillus indicus]MCM3788890.1 CatB-related O-acetyltransferase [Domibacillus indicus]